MTENNTAVLRVVTCSLLLGWHDRGTVWRLLRMCLRCVWMYVGVFSVLQLQL
jgi:hypothetical protein